ncbi:E3 ubiquitin-protein ligase UBR1 [Ceratobasidium sp. AG-Ba]|nr:E3 ubiquitin-protein ligase UBR1 [Ceratobasidium sp. AG-Ba]
MTDTVRNIARRSLSKPRIFVQIQVDHLAHQGVECTSPSLWHVPAVVDGMSEAAQTHCSWSRCLTKLAALQLDPNGDTAANKPSIQEAILHPVLPEWPHERMPFLLRDPMVVLVEIAAVAPALLPYMATLMYYAHLARTVLMLVVQLDRIPTGSALVVEDATPLLGDVKHICDECSPTLPQTCAKAEKVLAESAPGTFAKLLHALTLPAEEYDRLLAMLKIPPPSRLADFDYLQTALQSWSAHFGAYMNKVGLQPIARIEYPAPYRCAGAVGLYFLVRRCAILYLSAGNGSFGQAPYLDVHGEVDYGMRRGRRQFLNAQRFEELRRIWLTHGIPTFVARKLDG